MTCTLDTARWPIHVDVRYNVGDFIDKAMWRRDSPRDIRDRIIDYIEDGEVTEEQTVYLDLFEFDNETYHLDGDTIIFHFSWERRCGFVTEEGTHTAFKGTEAELEVLSRDRCGTRENHHGHKLFPISENHDFEPYPIPVPNEG